MTIKHQTYIKKEKQKTNLLCLEGCIKRRQLHSKAL